jgi:hypothetical protein
MLSTGILGGERDFFSFCAKLREKNKRENVKKLRVNFIEGGKITFAEQK